MAAAYAEQNCTKYFKFQSVWPQIMARLENDQQLCAALVASIEQRTFGDDYVAPAETAETAAAAEAEAAAAAAAAAEAPAPEPARRPGARAYAAPGTYNLDPGMTAEIRLDLDE